MNNQNISVKEYQKQQADCNDLCNITQEMVDKKPDLMMCVTCPFCKVLVNAILTNTTIACPACEVVVDR